jgi:hypothetical protein
MPVESGTENWGSTTSQRFPESSKASKRGFCGSLKAGKLRLGSGLPVGVEGGDQRHRLGREVAALHEPLVVLF